MGKDDALVDAPAEAEIVGVDDDLDHIPVHIIRKAAAKSRPAREFRGHVAYFS
jgi:hypothetical protein